MFGGIMQNTTKPFHAVIPWIQAVIQPELTA